MSEAAPSSCRIGRSSFGRRSVRIGRLPATFIPFEASSSTLVNHPDPNASFPFRSGYLNQHSLNYGLEPNLPPSRS